MPKVIDAKDRFTAGKSKAMNLEEELKKLQTQLADVKARAGSTGLATYLNNKRKANQKANLTKKGSEVNPQQLLIGIEIEKEHTSNKAKARKIALDHLAEFPDYYTRLKKMEAKAKAENK